MAKYVELNDVSKPALIRVMRGALYAPGSTYRLINGATPVVPGSGYDGLTMLISC